MATRGRGHRWVCPDPALLGLTPLEDLCRQWDISEGTVRRWYHRNNVPFPTETSPPSSFQPLILAVHAEDPTLSYQGIAERVGCSRAWVGVVFQRQRLVPSRPQHRPCPVDQVERLGKVPDGVFVKELGVGFPTVVRWRKEHGVPPYRLPQKTLPYDHLLGKIPDMEIVRTFDVWQSAVVRRRKQLGVPPYRAKAGAIAYVALLGEMPDRALADQLGVSVTAVRAARRYRRVPVYKA